jgi:sec-independent protein translocase protein TatB
MFFNIGGAEILVIAMVALIAVGPEQLPVVLRKVGRAVAQVRSMTAGLRDEFMAGLDDASEAVNPNRWIKGSGRPGDPIVPRGLADRSNGDAIGAMTPPEDTPAKAPEADGSELDARPVEPPPDGAAAPSKPPAGERAAGEEPS